MADKRSIYQFESGQGQQNSLMLMDNPDASASSGYTTEKLSIGELGAVIGAILYTQLLDTNVKNIFGGINELFARCMNIADDYDDTETYYTGDYVFYQNVLYKCNDDGVTGTWDATKWNITTVADEISELKSDITTANYWKTNKLTIANDVAVNAGVETQPITVQVPQISGYTVLTFTEVRATGYHGAKVTVQAELANANELVYALYNPSNVNATVTVTVRLIYVKTIT